MDVDNAASQNGNGTGNGNEGTAETQKPTWIEQLPEDLRADQGLYSYKTIGDMVKAHKTALSERDGLIKVPGEGATDEERAAFYQRLGRPEGVDKYQFGKPEGLPEDVPYSPELEKAYKSMAFDLGLSDATASKVFNWYHDIVKQNVEGEKLAREQKQVESVNTLKNEWKNSFDGNKEIAVRTFREFGKGHEAILEEKVGGIPLGDHPAFLKLFHSIGLATMDDSAVFDGKNQGHHEMSEEERAAKRYPYMKPQ